MTPPTLGSLLVTSTTSTTITHRHRRRTVPECLFSIYHLGATRGPYASRTCTSSDYFTGDVLDAFMA